MKIVIYGMGMMGILLFEEMMECNGVDVVAVTDTNATVRNTLDGKKKDLFVESEELAQVAYDYILISSDKYYEEIESTIIQKGIDSAKVVKLSELNEMLVDESSEQCSTCGKKIFKWLPVGHDYKIFGKKHIVGGGRRSSKCPACGSCDRERAQIAILRKYTDVFNGGKKILHMAPEKNLAELLKEGNDYVSGDLVKGRGDVIADITALPFADNSFDFIVCNHVLEHIPDDRKALSELLRCINKGGKLVVSVPWCSTEKTFQNDNISTDEDRKYYYGQKDHVRLYGNDFSEILSDSGFDVTMYKISDAFTESEIIAQKYIADDVVWICSK